MAKLFPVRITFEFLMIRGSDGTVVTATSSPRTFTVPTEDQLASIIEKATAKVLDEVGPDFRLMTHSEVWDHVIEEKTGQGLQFAPPSIKDGDQWWREESSSTLAERHARLLCSHSEEEDD